MTVRSELDLAWSEWQNADLYKRWRKANPGEAAKLDAYRAGGARPVLATATGRALVAETAAWILAAPVVEPPPPTPIAKRLTRIEDFPVGDSAGLGDFFYQQEKSPDRAAIVMVGTDKAIRTRCAVGDINVAGSGSGERCELMHDNYAFGGQRGGDAKWAWVAGEEFVRGVRFRLDSAFDAPGPLYGTDYMAWSNIVQTHTNGGNTQSPFQLNLCTSSAVLGMRIIGGGLTSNLSQPYGVPVGCKQQWWWTRGGPPSVGDHLNNWTVGAGMSSPAAVRVSRNVWHTLIINVRFGDGDGHARVWLDGQPVFEVADTKVGFADDTAYLKFGMYRATGATGDSSIYWGDWFDFPSVADALAFTGWT